MKEEEEKEKEKEKEKNIPEMLPERSDREFTPKKVK